MNDIDPNDIDSIDAHIREVCEQHDRYMAEQRDWEANRRAAEALPVQKNEMGGLVYKEHANNAPARALMAYDDAPPGDEEEPSADPLIEALGEMFSDEQWRGREELQQALAPLQREIAAMRTELAELRGFRDGLVGRDVPTAWFKLRGEYREGHVYGRLDIVSRDGAWWIARCDDPGPIGGDGWKEGPRARDGEKGARGERGLKGSKGAPGRDAPKFVRWDIDRANYRVVAKMSDGSEQVLELRPLFAQFLDELDRRG